MSHPAPFESVEDEFKHGAAKFDASSISNFRSQSLVLNINDYSLKQKDNDSVNKRSSPLSKKLHY